ncbi:MAG: TRAP transporter substrate-binding protein [Alkalilacustris sp.]
MAKKTVKLYGTVAAVGALALMTTAQQAQAFDTIRWQVPIAFASTLTALGDTMPWVADRLREVTDGAVDLRVAEPGAVIPALAVFDNVSEGNIDAGYSWMGYERGTVPAAALFGAMPFGLESAEFVAWMTHHGGQELLEETFHPFNVHPVLCGVISPETAGWFRQEMPTVESLEGLRFRAAGVGGEIFAEFGMSVSLLPGGELFQALETGVIDGTEFSLPTVDEQLGFYQVADYLYLPGWHQPTTNQFLYINLDVWEDLSPQTQAVIETTCMAGTMFALARAEALQGAAMQRFAERGTNIRTYSDEQIEAFHAATQRVFDRLRGEDEMFDRVLGSMEAFQMELRPWREMGYLPRDWMTRIGIE